jgi:hypothetical protein
MIGILFLAANPVGTTPLAFDEEVREIDDRLQRARWRDRFRVEKAFAIRKRELIEQIQRHQPTIVHFSGHGSESGELIFAAEGGEAAAAPVEAVSDIFRILAPKGIRCVVLNACYSATQARAIAQHVDCVVGMGRAVSDGAAIEFASQLYSSIAYGSSVRDAFDLARASLDLARIPESATPRLSSRQGVDPGALVLAHATADRPGAQGSNAAPVPGSVTQHIHGDNATVAGRDIVAGGDVSIGARPGRRGSS